MRRIPGRRQRIKVAVRFHKNHPLHLVYGDKTFTRGEITGRYYITGFCVFWVGGAGSMIVIRPRPFRDHEANCTVVYCVK